MEKELGYIHNNIKLLRQRCGYTQQELADLCEFTRSKIAGYETNIQPSIIALLKLSEQFDVSIDIILKEDLSKWPEYKLRQLDYGSQSYAMGTHLRVLATTVDSESEENTEMVTEKVRAGYMQAYSDPDFIKNLPRLNLPMLSKNKKYRAFQVSGDSMLPIQNNDWVVCSYVENWLLLKDGQKYVVVTERDGVVLKTVYNKILEKDSFLLVSSNSIYKPYYLKSEEIREIWKMEWWFTNQIE